MKKINGYSHIEFKTRSNQVAFGLRRPFKRVNSHMLGIEHYDKRRDIAAVIDCTHNTQPDRALD